MDDYRHVQCKWCGAYDHHYSNQCPNKPEGDDGKQ